MAKWAQRYKTPQNAKEEFLKAVETFADAYPEVASILAGTYSASGEVETPPFGVRLFINGGQLKFQISRRDDPLSGFGVISNPENILDSVESALSKDEVGWKANSAQTLPY